MLGLVAWAMAAEVTTEGGVVKVDGQVVTDVGAPPRAAVVSGDRLYVLTGAGVVETWTLGASPARVASAQAPDAVGLFVAGGRVWAEVRETKAVPLERVAEPIQAETLAPSTPAAPAAAVATVAPATKTLAKVVRAESGVAVIDRGRADGLVAGDNVRFLGTEEMLVPSMEGAGQERREVEKVVATGRVRVLEEGRALVDVARGGRVEAGDRVEVKPGAYRYPVAPERLDGFREIGGVVRPLLALDTVGVAMVGEAYVTLGFRSPWYVTARMAPIGVGVSRDGNPLTVAALGSGGYDSRYFAVGLGVGWSMLNSDPGSVGYGYADDGITPEFEDVDSAFAFVQEARLGARDGVHVGVRNTLLLTPVYSYEYRYDEATGQESYEVTSEGDEFVFGGIAMELAIPTGDRTDLFVDWGTGQAGATWVEGGVSSWVRGNGDVGSIGLRVGAGYANLMGNPNDERVDLYGPMVSVGGRYRF